MKTRVKHLETGLDRVLTATGYLGAILVVLSACCVTYDVIMRGVWNSPTNWVFEYSIYLIAGGVYLSTAYVLRENGHIKIDVVTCRLSNRARSLLNFVALIWSSATCIALTYSALRMFLRSIAFNTLSNTSLATPLWISQVPLVIGFILLSVQAIRMAFQQGTWIGQRKIVDEAIGEENKSSRILNKPGVVLTIFLVLLVAETAMVACGGSLRILGVVLLLLTLLASGTPIFLSMALSGGIAFYFIFGGGLNSLFQLAPIGNNLLMSPTLTAIPLFVFGAGILAIGGVSDKIFTFFRLWLPGVRGKLAVVTVLACGLFAAACGSSVATAAAFAMIAVPLMLASNYDKRLAYGVVAAGGTLGPMIPPSLGPIIFGQLTGLSVAALLIAGLMPGILMIVVFSIYIVIKCWKDPRYDSDIAYTSVSWKDRLQSLRNAGVAFMAPVIVIGGIYTGFATPVEAASLLVAYAVIVTLIQNRSNLKTLKPALSSSILSSTMIYSISFGAIIFTASLALLQAPQGLATFISTLQVPPIVIIIAIMVLLIILGCFMEPISIILITVPILWPVVDKLGFDGIWFCTLFNLNLEVGMLTPPVGLNLYVLTGATKDKFEEVVRGAIPFILLLVLCLALLIIFPQIATWLPSTIR